MGYQCKVEDMTKQHTAHIRTRTAVSGLPDALGRSYGLIAESVQPSGLSFSGPPYVLYFNMDMEDLDIEIGIPINGVYTGEGEVKAGEIPAGQYASCIHTGPYEDITRAYQALSDWMQSQELVPQGSAYEIYLNDPSDTPPEKLQTQILFPVLES